MDLQEFENKFSTENQCLDYLFHLRWKYGYRCPRCQCDKMWEITDYKYKCKNCGYQSTVIAGTLFQDTHLPLILWFRAMWYVSQNNQVSAAGLQKELELGSNRTALTMLNKINRARIPHSLEKLQGKIEVYRKSIRIYNKMTTLVIAAEVNNKRIGKIRLGVIENINSEQINSFIENCIEAQSVIISEKWNGYDKIISQGYIQGKRAASHEFPYTQKVCKKLVSWLQTLKPTEDIADYLNKYCKIFNSLKTNITFEELLNRAVCLRPKPKATNLLNRKK